MAEVGRFGGEVVVAGVIEQVRMSTAKLLGKFVKHHNKLLVIVIYCGGEILKLKLFFQKKVFITIVILILTCGIPYGKVEFLTWKYGEQFEQLHKLSNMIDDIAYLKVMHYSKEKAQVYYVHSEFKVGLLYSFEKENEEWVLKSWKAVWSKSGSADDFIWPYYR